MVWWSQHCESNSELQSKNSTNPVHLKSFRATGLCCLTLSSGITPAKKLFYNTYKPCLSLLLFSLQLTSQLILLLHSSQLLLWWMKQKHQLSTRVSQALALELLLFAMYISSLGPHSFSLHWYADDTQLYLPFPPDELSVSNKISNCLSHISHRCRTTTSNLQSR